jgi:hypothetical protein
MGHPLDFGFAILDFGLPIAAIQPGDWPLTCAGRFGNGSRDFQLPDRLQLFSPATGSHGNERKVTLRRLASNLRSQVWQL